MKEGNTTRVEIRLVGTKPHGVLWVGVRSLEFGSKSDGKPLGAFLTGNSWNFGVLDPSLYSFELEPTFGTYHEEPWAFPMVFTVLVMDRHSCQVEK